MLNFLFGFYHYLWAFFSALFFGFPSRKIKVIGVIGTKGKSTVVDFITEILEEAGFKVAALSSIKIKIGKKEQKNLFKMTMPGRGFLQKFLKRAKDKNCQYAVIEVTSEGILQHRHKFIDFETAIFTNLSPEHIERHGSFENYRAAKGELFKTTKKNHILNLDDENVKFYLQFPAEKKIGFTLINNQQPSINKENIEVIQAKACQEERGGASFKVEDIDFHLNLLGKFNIQNALAAISVGISENISLEICKKALEKIKKVSGRMEIVIKEPFKVIVDYAHTPDALLFVYRTLRNPEFQIPSSKMICVLGSCGGGRDKWKRPKLGEIASQFCDEIILTNEDPYDEPPMEIIEQIFKGITDDKQQATRKILSRREAIRKALTLANKRDIVIITGKGCEPWMCVVGGKKVPWDDRRVVREEIEKLKQYEKI